MAVYCAERPCQERLAASARVSEMIASAINVDPALVEEASAASERR
jgi:hypothetical protein